MEQEERGVEGRRAGGGGGGGGGGGRRTLEETKEELEKLERSKDDKGHEDHIGEIPHTLSTAAHRLFLLFVFLFLKGHSLVWEGEEGEVERDEATSLGSL